MNPLETVEVKASDLSIGDRFFDEYGDMWQLKRVESKPNGYLNLWFDNLEGTESFYPINATDTLPKVVDSPEPEIALPSLTEVATVDPTVYQDEQIYATDVKIRDRIHIYKSAVDPYVGIVTEIHYDSAIGSMELVFENGTRYQCKPTDHVSRSAQDCVVQAANGHVGYITLTLRLDNDPDAQNVAKSYALYIRNQRPEIANAILYQLMNIQK